MQTSPRDPTRKGPARPDRRILGLAAPPGHKAYLLIGFINIAAPVVVMSVVCLTAGVVTSLQMVGVVETSVSQKVFTWSSLTTSTGWLYTYMRALRGPPPDRGRASLGYQLEDR